MNTTTTTKQPVSQQAIEMRDNKSVGEVAVLERPRLPFHPAIEQRFGITIGDWKTLVEAIFPSAKSPNAVILALNYCRSRKLDIFKRPVHIVPMWQKAIKRPDGSWTKGQYVETVWPSIAELRTTAFRTGQYAGNDEIEFGPDVILTFTLTNEEQGEYGEITTKEKEITITYPEWGKMVVYRLLKNGTIGKFVGPKLHWMEACARTKGNQPNDMWLKRPHDQFEKVVEAAALRRAFPEEMGNDLTAEEMEGRDIDSDTPYAANSQTAERQTRSSSPTAPSPAAVTIDEEDPPPEEAIQTTAKPQQQERPHVIDGDDTPPPPDPEEFEQVAWLQGVEAHFKALAQDPNITFEQMMGDQKTKINDLAHVPEDAKKVGRRIAARWATAKFEALSKG